MLNRGDVLKHSAPAVPGHNPYEGIGTAHLVFGIGANEYVVDERIAIEAGGRVFSVNPIFAVYRARYVSEKFGDEAVWVRPLDNMFEQISTSGLVAPRFEVITAESE